MEDNKINYFNEEFQKNANTKFSFLTFFFTFPYLFYKKLWVPSGVYLVIRFLIMWTFVEAHYFIYMIPLAIVKLIFAILYGKIYRKTYLKRIETVVNSDIEEAIKLERINNLTKGHFVLFVSACSLFFAYFILIAYIITEFPPDFNFKIYKIDNDNVIHIVEDEITITKLQRKKIDLHFNKQMKIQKDTILKWESSDESILDVSSCKRQISCYVKPLKAGDVTITVTLEDKKYNVYNQDKVTLHVLDTDTINIYVKDNHYYVDKKTDLKYQDDPSYKQVYEHVCHEVNCDFKDQDDTTLIIDGTKEYFIKKSSINPNNIVVAPSVMYVGDKLSKANITLKDIKDFESPFSGQGARYILFLGDQNRYGYTAVYNYQTENKIDQEYNSYKLLYPHFFLFTTKNTYVYNFENDVIDKVIDIGAANIFYAGHPNYYYLSGNSLDFHLNTVILDSGFNPIFNSKMFAYALLEGERLYTYEVTGARKEIVIYDLVGNRVENNVPEGFEVIDFVFNQPYVIGVLNNKITIYNLSNNTILDDSISVEEGSKYFLNIGSQLNSINGKTLEKKLSDNRTDFILQVTKGDTKKYYYYSFDYTQEGYKLNIQEMEF